MSGTYTNGHSNGLLSLERKVLVGFGIASILLVVIGSLSYVSVVRFRSSTAEVDHTNQVLNSLSGLLTDVAMAESSQRGFLISAKEKHQEEFDAAAERIEGELAHVRGLTRDNPVQRRNMDELVPHVTNRIGLMRRRMGIRRSDGFEASIALLVPDGGKGDRDVIHACVQRMQEEEGGLLVLREAATERRGFITGAAILTGCAVALGLVVVVLLIVRKDFETSRRGVSKLQSERDSGEERLSRIIDSAMDAIITVDEQQLIRIFNPAAEKMFGCAAAEAIGKPLERFLPARFRTSHREHLREFGKNSETRRKMGGFNPLRALRANGEEFPIEASISQAEVNGKKMFTAIVRDVTEATKAQDIRSKLVSIVESSDDAIISKTLDGTITSWNPAAERLFGHSAEEAIGQPMLLIIPPDMENEERMILERIARGERIEHYETRRVRKDGGEITVAETISPLRDGSGRVLGASKIARDITERKRAEEEIRQQAAMLRLATALVRDMEDRIVFWTRGAEQLYGYSQAEAVGQISRELLKTKYPQPLSDIQTTLNRDGVWEGELEHSTRVGGRVVVASQWVLHKDASGKSSRILEVCTDITALRRAELIQMRSQKLEALGTLAGGIAHDFNNILSAINGSAVLAISQFPPEHPVQACLTEIEKAGTRAADLVRRILSFSRPQEQNMRAQPMAPVVEEALKLVRSTIPSMIEIRTELKRDAPNAKMDATQIYQVVVNLATNASHAIGNKPGLIEVILDGRTVKEEEILLYSELKPGEYAHLQVSDNGSGMDAATLQKIFDPFFTTKPTGKGTGLGLSVVHGIVGAHQGAIKVYSEVGKGTSFHLYFPAVKDAVEVPAQAPEREISKGQGEKILFVDDEGVLLFVGAMTLEQKGYKVTGVPNGEAALRELRENPNEYDAVLTDLSMPGISGLQLAHQIRKILPEMPVILMSGYVNPEDQARADKLGIRAILQKPVKSKDLLGTLASVLEQSARLQRDRTR